MYRKIALTLILALATLATTSSLAVGHGPRAIAPKRDSRTIWRYAVEGGGTFEFDGGKCWTQHRRAGTSIAYQELARTPQYVELYDAARKMRVRLYSNIYHQHQPETGWLAGAQGKWE